ncbi:DUF6348 family protein [Dyella sp.]|uniref:DUF6348 family protein n=1 Tax=Dyella sp. TaxID=1869338 RepID=UPI002D791955|nr:DUF6348 family protein [Dyella sp.]HET6432026.1 DUF6348 family protein [Dyella sp.]
MDDAALQNTLRRLFQRHEVELEPDEDGWLLTDGDFPAIRAHWQAGEGGEPGRLDVDVVVAEDRCIEDSFAGTDARAALDAFEQSSFHLLLAACWYLTDDRRMRIAAWDIGVRTWDVFVGPLVTRPSAAAPQPMPADAALALQQAVGQLSLSPQLHWIHLLHRRGADGAVLHEALLDGEPWPAASEVIAATGWPELAPGTTARQLVLLDVRDY